MFIGRERELALLEDRYASGSFEFVPIYGRRRVGKTTLIKRFLEGLNIKTVKEFENRKAISIKDLHSMRHVFCYYAGQVGISLAVVQSIVGHMTQEMTKHYSLTRQPVRSRKPLKNCPRFW